MFLFLFFPWANSSRLYPASSLELVNFIYDGCWIETFVCCMRIDLHYGCYHNILQEGSPIRKHITNHDENGWIPFPFRRVHTPGGHPWHGDDLNTEIYVLKLYIWFFTTNMGNNSDNSSWKGNYFGWHFVIICNKPGTISYTSTFNKQ